MKIHENILEYVMKAGLYQHYKGGLYQIHGIARHSETSEGMVVYQHLDGTPGLWIRPIDMFNEKIIVNGVEKPRFEYKESFTTNLPKFVDPSTRT